jgi:hypothetical protein
MEKFAIKCIQLLLAHQKRNLSSFTNLSSTILQLYTFKLHETKVLCKNGNNIFVTIHWKIWILARVHKTLHAAGFNRSDSFGSNSLQEHHCLQECDAMQPGINFTNLSEEFSVPVFMVEKPVCSQ